MKLTFASFLAFVGIICSTSVNAQEAHDHLRCLINTMTEAYKEAHPEAAEIMEQESQELEDFTRNFEGTTNRSEVLIIPVVFHIVHANGVENISNAQVLSAMEVINEDFNALTPGVNNVVSQFQNMVGNVELEFRLAKLDLNGNCTNGIIRTFSQQTFNGDENIKVVSPTWGRASYLNIWVCNNIDGAAGYAYLPGGAPVAGDGILLQHDYVGRIGTSNQTRSHALSHEIGHWANLRHTWGQSDTPALPTNCSEDDGVADTPNTIGWTSCNLSGSTCGTLDNVQNFMDYAYCYRMFTTGQTNRMRAALNSGIASRNQLHTQANLLETGVIAPDVLCDADFSVEETRVICPGDVVTFEDYSFNGPTSWLWTFEGGTPASSTSPSPEVMYNSPGVYDVTLFVSNPNGGLTEVKNDFITVLPQADNAVPFYESFESFNSLEPNNENWFVVNQDGGTIKWQLSSNVGYSGSKSVYVRGRNNTNGAVEFLQSPTYDLTDLDENAVLTFKYAHAQRQGSTADRLRVWISRDCGDSWTVRRTISMPNLPTVSGNVATEFVPSGQADWAEVSIDNIVSTFLTNEFRFRFEFESFNGNNVYIDDINIIDGLTVGIDEVDFAKEVTLFPNPTNGNAQISLDLRRSGLVSVRVLDISGRTLKQVSSQLRSVGSHVIDIEMNDMSAGMYLVSIDFEGQSLIEKLIVQP